MDLAVFTGKRGALTLVPGLCTSQDRLPVLHAEAGTTYYIRIAVDPGEGRFRFTLDTA